MRTHGNYNPYSEIRIVPRNFVINIVFHTIFVSCYSE